MTEFIRNLHQPRIHPPPESMNWLRRSAPVECDGQRGGRMAARHVGGNPEKGVRKVRAPQRRVAGNARPSRDEEQCHSDDADRRREPVIGVKRGKLHPEQGQIGGRNPRGATRRGRGALPSPRVGRKSRRATGGPRWMAIPIGASRWDRTRLTDRLADISGRRLGGPCLRSTSRDRRPGGGARSHGTTDRWMAALGR
jgi:hypothetical protein